MWYLSGFRNMCPLDYIQTRLSINRALLVVYRALLSLYRALLTLRKAFVWSLYCM